MVVILHLQNNYARYGILLTLHVHLHAYLFSLFYVLFSVFLALYACVIFISFHVT